MSPKSLSEIQLWVQERVVSDRLILPEESEIALSDTAVFPHNSRWHIYQYAIEARQLESLEDDFHVSRKLVGASFREMIQKFLKENPSKYPSLLHLGQKLPEFFRNDCTIKKNYPWLSELAQFEFLILSGQYYENKTRTIDAEKLKLLEIISPDKLNFLIDPTLQLFFAHYPVTKMVEQEVVLAEELSYNVIYSREFQAFYTPIDNTQFQALNIVKESGSLLAVLEFFNENEYFSDHVFETFQRWMQYNWIQDITVSD